MADKENIPESLRKFREEVQQKARESESKVEALKSLETERKKTTRLQNLLSKFKNKGSKNKKSREKILSPYELMKREQKIKKENQEVRMYKNKQSFSKSYPGKSIQAARFLKQAAQAYPASSSSLRLQALRRARFSPGFRPRPQMSEHERIFWAGSRNANQVEKEVAGMGSNSFSMDGARAAAQIAREVNAVSNLQHIIPSLSVDKEAFAAANILGSSKINNPALDVSREAWAFSNILGMPTRRKRRR